MPQKASAARTPGGKQTEPSQSVPGCLIQLAWSLGGFGVLLILWVTILRERPWTFTLRDVLFWITVLGMIAARQVDARRYQARTSAGEPATARDVRLYALVLLCAAGASWCIAQAFHV